MRKMGKKWYRGLFWILIICTVAEAVFSGDGEGNPDTLHWIVNNLATAAYGVVLLKMISLSAHFRMAGLCKVASAVIGILSVAVSELSIAVVLIVVIMAAVVDIVGEYQEFSGHADFVCDKDLVLSEKWLRLRLWYIVMLAGLTGGVVCGVLLVLPGLIILLACGIGLVVVSIVKIIYVYRTARLCQVRDEEEVNYNYN